MEINEIINSDPSLKCQNLLGNKVCEIFHLIAKN